MPPLRLLQEIYTFVTGLSRMPFGELRQATTRGSLHWLYGMAPRTPAVVHNHDGREDERKLNALVTRLFSELTPQTLDFAAGRTVHPMIAVLVKVYAHDWQKVYMCNERITADVA